MASRMSKTRLIIVVTLIIAVAAILGIALNCSSCGPSDSLPTFPEAETILSELEGTAIVLNFWTTTCPACVKQLPYLEAVAQQSEGEIKVVAINVGQSASTVQKFFGDYEPTMIVALDSTRQTFRDYSLKYDNPQGYIPFTLFVDSEGIMQYKQIGAFASEEQLQEALNSIFGL